MTIDDLLIGVNAALVAKYPQTRVYVKDVPKDFVRPSFFLMSGGREMHPATRFTADLTDRVSITYNATMDAAGCSDLIEIQNVQVDVAALFAAPIQCEADGEKRFLMGRAKIAVPGLNEGAIEIVFNYHDDYGTAPAGTADVIEKINVEGSLNNGSTQA